MSRTTFLLCTIIVVSMVGLRWNVGADWDGYKELFFWAGQGGLERMLNYGDPGYQILNWGVRRLGGTLWQVNVLCASVFTWGLMRLANQQPRPWIALVAAVPYLVIVVAMGYTRQAVAVGFIMAGLADLQRGASLLRFAAYAVAAAVFHKTSVAVIPLVYLSGSRNFALNLILGLALTILFYNLFLEKSLAGFMRSYLGTGYSSQGAAIRAAINLVPAILFLARPTAFGLRDRERKIWRNFAVVACLLPIALTLSPSSTAVDRLAVYILPLQMLVFSRVSFAYKSHGTASPFIVVYSAAILFVWLNFASNAQEWIPYRFVPLEDSQNCCG